MLSNIIGKRLLPLFLYLSVASAAIAPWNPPLSTRGRYIVDADGNRFKLKSGNWHGGSGTWKGEGDINQDSNHHASENSHAMPLGLQYAHIDQILDAFESAGVNSIRLPFSNQMIHDHNIIQDDWVRSNPQFRGKTALQVYDAVVEALTSRGFAVVLNNHTIKTRWCCGVNDENERWNASQSDETWAQDWLFMVRRFQGNKRVVGADLYNEVRRTILDDPNWGLGDKTDWFLASQALGDRIHIEANSDILIMVEGINWYGLPVDGFPHGRPLVTPARTLSHTLVMSNKLVYAAHFYGYTGPQHSGASGVGETTDARYSDMNEGELRQTMYDSATFAVAEGQKHFTAPVWISEFGAGSMGESEKVKTWFTRFTNYLVEYDLDFAIWPLVGYLSNGSGNGWALFSWDVAPSPARIVDPSKNGDWRWPQWNRLINNELERKGNVPEEPRWNMINNERTDFVQSITLRRRGNFDWDNGAYKATCPDTERVIGISRKGRRGLCTDSNYGTGLFGGDRVTVGVWDEKYVSNGDWAGSHTKLECPRDHFVIGYSFKDAVLNSVLCAKASRGLGIQQRTVWFDQNDNGTGPGGDFAFGNLKGVCAPDEYVAGIAYRKLWIVGGEPAALLCRK